MAIPLREGQTVYRPGVYMRFINSGKHIEPAPVPFRPKPEEEPDNAVFVSPEGVMYARGKVFSVVVGESGENILVFEKNTGVKTTVSDGTLFIRNPGQ